MGGSDDEVVGDDGAAAVELVTELYAHCSEECRYYRYYLYLDIYVDIYLYLHPPVQG